MASVINQTVRTPADNDELTLAHLSSVSMREGWIRDQLSKRVPEYSKEYQLHIMCASWNVAAKRPVEDLSAWLKPEDGPEPDIYAIGFQEIVDLNAGNLLVDHNAARPWESVIERTLQQKYQLIASKQLVGLCLCVYVRRPLVSHITNVQDDKVGVGIMGVGGNKGAVAIRLNIFDTSFCFINAHLAAHQHNTTGRNSDYHNICARVQFKRPQKTSPNNSVDIPIFDNSNLSPYLTLFDHDHVFWVGDLNYRLTIQDIDKVHDMIENDEISTLLLHDQLILEKAAGNAFKDWQEGQVSFLPTYKYQPGTPYYERRPEKKKRAPAWCDRIQWISNSEVVQHFYQRAELHISDHKPVSSLFTTTAINIIPEKQYALYCAIITKLESWENLVTPRIQIPLSIDVGEIRFEETVSKTFMVKNIGNVVAEFYLKRTSSHDGNVSKPWLTIWPQTAVLSPGQEIEINLEVKVTNVSALSLVSMGEYLKDAVFFQLKDGKLHQLKITGNYISSCFGLSLNYLANNTGNVGDITPENLPMLKPPTGFTVPKEIWRLVDAILTRGVDSPNLFKNSGFPNEILVIRECLDSGMEFDPEFDIHSFAECLILLLNSLSEPVFPAAIAYKYNKNQNISEFCQVSLTLLPAIHYSSFVYILSFLRHILSYQDQNGVELNALVVLFSKCLMGDSDSDRTEPAAILRHFLISSDFD